MPRHFEQESHWVGESLSQPFTHPHGQPLGLRSQRLQTACRKALSSPHALRSSCWLQIFRCFQTRFPHYYQSDIFLIFLSLNMQVTDTAFSRKWAVCTGTFTYFPGRQSPSGLNSVCWNSYATQFVKATPAWQCLPLSIIHLPPNVEQLEPSDRLKAKKWMNEWMSEWMKPIKGKAPKQVPLD